MICSSSRCAPFHAIAEDGAPFKAIAEVISYPKHFGWVAMYAGMEAPSSSTRTRAELDWKPAQPGLIADLDHPAYFAQWRRVGAPRLQLLTDHAGARATL